MTSATSLERNRAAIASIGTLLAAEYVPTRDRTTVLGTLQAELVRSVSASREARVRRNRP